MRIVKAWWLLGFFFIFFPYKYSKIFFSRTSTKSIILTLYFKANFFSITIENSLNSSLLFNSHFGTTINHNYHSWPKTWPCSRPRSLVIWISLRASGSTWVYHKTTLFYFKKQIKTMLFLKKKTKTSFSIKLKNNP